MSYIQLFNKKETSYPNSTFDQWKVCVEMADKVSERRIKANNFFISLNSGIATLSTLINIGSRFFIPIIGMLVAIIWIFNISNYKKLNEAKYEVINKLEEKLSAKPYNYEWYIIQKNNEKYKGLTHGEKLVPMSFIVIYILIFIINIFKV